MYWLDVDYRVVAAAALRCGACFTALLYLEHWCEAAHGRLVLGDDQPLAAVRQFAGASLPLTEYVHVCCDVHTAMPVNRAALLGTTGP